MSAKLARLTEMLREIFAANNKVLIFSAFRRMSDLIDRVIKARMYVSSWVMDGRTPARSRQQVVDTFSGTRRSCRIGSPPCNRRYRVEHHGSQSCDSLHA